MFVFLEDISLVGVLFYSSCLVEIEHTHIEERQVLRLQLVLLSFQEVVLAGAKLHDVLQAEFKLLAQQVVRSLGTLGRSLGCLKLALVGVGLQPVVFDGRIELRLLVFEVKHTALFLNVSLVDCSFCCTIVTDGDADADAATYAKVLLDL